MTDLQANVPDIRTPFLNPVTGQIDPVWWQFLLKLFVRTGSGTGTGSGTAPSNAKAIASINGLLNSIGVPSDMARHILDGLSAFDQQVPAFNYKQPLELGYVPAHGMQTDPLMHSQVTQSTDGFMIASDKSILDAMTTGGTFVPVITFATPGNLSVTYSARVGEYTKIGRQVCISFLAFTSAFTWTTSSGNLILSGLPFVCGTPIAVSLAIDFQGITKAGFTQLSATLLNGASQLTFIANGFGASRAAVVAADVPSGGSVALSGNFTYHI